MRLNEGPAHLYYLKQVLGADVASTGRASFKELRMRLAVFLESEPQPAARELIQKMLAAISEHEYLIQVGTIDEAQLARHDINFAITFSKSVLSARSLKWVELPSLDLLLGPPEKANAAKKEAWAKLRALKQEMDVWIG